MRPITKLFLGVSTGAGLAFAIVPLAAQPVVTAVPLAAKPSPAPGAAPQTAVALAPEDLPPTTDVPPTMEMPAQVTTATRSPAPHAPLAASTVVPAAPAAAATAAISPAPTAPASSADMVGTPDSNGIVATVDDTPISEYDIRQRVQLQLALMPPEYKPSDADLKRMRTDTLQRLEEEAVERAEAVKRHLTVSPVDINKRIDDVLTRQKMTHAQMTKALADHGTSEAALRQQYIADEVWQKVIQDQFSDNIRAAVTPAQIEAQMRRNAEGANKTHYDVLEIFLPSNGPEQDAKVLETAQGIVDQLHKGTTFPDVAREYSRNPSAAMGGEIGWVYDGQLEPALNDALSKMKKGNLSAPIRGTGGYYLLGLRDRQEPMGTNVSVPEPVTSSSPPGTLPLARLLLPVGGMPKDQVDQVMQTALEIQANVPSCPALQQLATQQIKGSVYTDMGNAKLSDYSEQFQKALAGTKSGDIAMPFIDEAGIEIIARCDPRPGPPRVAFHPPTRDEVESTMFQDIVATYSRRYLSELRRDANIQERGPNGQIIDSALASVH